MAVPEDALAFEVLADDGAIVRLLVGMGWLMVAVTVDEAAPFAGVAPGRKPQLTIKRIVTMSGMTIASGQSLFTAPASFRMAICLARQADTVWSAIKLEMLIKHGSRNGQMLSVPEQN